MTVANVNLWGRTIGAVSWNDDSKLAHFEYGPAFIDSGIEVSPITMPLAEQIYSFPALPRNTFHGLPGLLADSLPDRFGNALIETRRASIPLNGCAIPAHAAWARLSLPRRKDRHRSTRRQSMFRHWWILPAKS
jgi:hypothetical protein